MAKEDKAPRREPPLYCALAAGGKACYVNASRRRVPMMSLCSPVLIVLNLLAIVVCGALGAAAGYGVLVVLGIGGVPGALIATLVGMVVATAAWAAGYAALRATGLVR